MIKRIFSIFLAGIILFSVLPLSALAVSASVEDAIYAAVEKTIKDYSRSVYRVNADDEAFSDFFSHGFFAMDEKLF